ncbi:hypothetical protein BDV32DRAFT_151190 [Aspergillus pseudonomiae]|uniref:Leucine-rich repeat domain-containing protein n=1 Tax=Aspergillus pseudonomiae TaxID=1506151 RepID=A0A5N6HYR6_9EURO|nr:uncharacterized protein BDV37DRAFT_289684 [Aspergillus pseudonomiae]KAB8258560.1 hypothetical protein BDV32DRAFT_151190 [Aspergillus pseudonomiae]KAE8397116.1 hypothetical protein BDV37DRAFT_289684 [Aspergillus pseudonomiae]
MSIFGLSEVTPEVILEICKHLETPKDRLNLVCCSRFFHDLCLPLLYQRLWTGGKDLAPIARVVRTLIKKPALAARVHTLHLFDWETYIGYNFAESDEALNAFKEDRAMEREQADTNEEANEGDADDQDGIEENRDDDDNASDNGSIYLKRFDYGPLREQAKLVTRSEDETDYWMDEITIGNADAWVALLLTLLPNLQRLEIEFPYGSLWVRWVLKWAIAGRLDSIPAFKSLSEVYVDWDSENVKACCRNIMPFFLLPSMRRLYASKLFDRLGMFEEAWVDRDDLTQVAQFSPVTHIEIDESDGQWGMWKVVGICKNLQSFKYNHSGCVEFDPVTFHEELFPLRETLQTIWLGIQESSHGNCMEVSHHCNNPLPSFKDFTSLKTLRLRAKNLPGLNLKSGRNHASMTFAEALPSSLETLQIADIGNRVNLRTLVRELQDHIEHALDSTPALREIAIELLLDSPRMPRLLLDLDRACTKVGIKFYVCGTHDGRAKWRTEGFTPRVQ